MTNPGAPIDVLRAATLAREACVEAAAAAYEDAGMRGLCAEGRSEAALGALRALDLREVLKKSVASAPAARRL